MPVYNHTAEMKAEVNKKLAALQAAYPGRAFTRTEISRACGLTDDAIMLTERKAIRKIRQRLGPALKELTS